MARDKKDDKLPALDPVETPQALNDKIAEYAQRHAKAKREQLEVDQLGRQIRDSIFILGDITDDGKVSYTIPDVVKVNIQTNTQRTVDGVKLIALGVAPELVQAATTETTSEPFIRLYPKVS